MTILKVSLTALILVATHSALAGGDEEDRYVHEVDLMSLVKRYLSPKGFLDSEFPPSVAEASPVLTDFYGAQAIADVTGEQIVNDFVPDEASIKARDDHSITLAFNDGFTARFYPVSSLSAAGAIVPISHAVVSGETWRENRQNLAQFLALLREKGLADRYLIPNEFYEAEKVTYAQMTEGSAAPIRIDPDLDDFFSTEDAILLFPEGVHGVSTEADELVKVLQRGDVDWLGMEMLNLEQQPILDRFNAAEAGTPAYAAAREDLVNYFAEAWNGRAGPKTSGEENYYFKLVESAHATGTKVIALEGSSLPFIFFRYGETTFGGAVRSWVWAEQVPENGRGILFGGGAHYYLDEPMNVQDFIGAQQPSRVFFVAKELKKPKIQ